MLRTYLEFSTSMPEEWNEAGDKCGANVLRAFAELLAEQGLIIDPIEDAGDHGWDFVAHGSRRQYFQVSPIEDILVITQELAFSWAFWKRKPPSDQAAILMRLNEQLAADSRFSNVRWYFPKEYSKDRRGAPTPLG